MSGIGYRAADGRSAARGAGVVAGLLLGVAALLAGCTVGPSQRPPVAVRGENMPAPPPPAGDRPRSGAAARARTRVPGAWSSATAPARWPPPCPPRRTACCGSTAPCSPSRPTPQQPGSGPDADRADAGRARRRPGRPPAAARRRRQRHPAVGDRRRRARRAGARRRCCGSYSLVGVDRRGAGIDDLDCGPAVARSAFVNIDPGGDGALPQLNLLLEQARMVVQDCYLVHSGALSGYRTASTAADVEQVRAALGVTRLSALGVGDGATAVSMWARTHPGAVGRVVLDGPPDARAGRARRRRGARGGRRVGVRRVRRGLRRRADMPARRRPPWRRSRPSSTACAASRSPPPTDGG